MKISETVKTETKAKEILTDQGATGFNNRSARCECGETQCLEGYNSEGVTIGYVAVCDSCGDDNAWVDEVFSF